jgi:sterol desaturase/sphingolipid hydroxylase (fatty acid hydroxylase superfamily)
MATPSNRGGGAPRSLLARAVEALGFVATIAMTALVFARLMPCMHGWQRWLLVPAMLAGLFVADLVSAVAHWFGDTFFAEDTPVLGAIVRPFRLHHRDPGAFRRHDLLERYRSNFLAALPLLIAAHAFCAKADGLGGAIGAATLAFASVALSWATQIHAFAHDRRAPRPIRWLQRCGLLLSVDHHALHHRGARDRAYGIVNGWSNGMLDRWRIFRLLERARERAEIATDLAYVFSNHVVMLAIVLPVSQLFAAARFEPLTRAITCQPTILQLAEIVVTVDIVQYGIHRLFHRVPLLWRFHAIHHSPRKLDWLAGARLHFVDLLVVRMTTMAPLVVAGFSETALHVYAGIAALNGVFIHTGMRVRLGVAEYLVVTPRYHAFHHAADIEAIDKNFAFHLPVLDHVFGTRFLPPRRWPERYGMNGRQVRGGWLHQWLVPLQSSSAPSETTTNDRVPFLRHASCCASPMALGRREPAPHVQ